MGRQTTDNPLTFWRAINGRKWHAVWDVSGRAVCGSLSIRLTPVDPERIAAGSDYLSVDQKVCRDCLRLADKYESTGHHIIRR